MTRLSPAVGRVVSVLNFFAEHPQQAFTLTQIMKSLRMSRATCHALLAGLVDGSYLYRNSNKSYVLGPALLALARTAEQHFSPLDVARQEMRALADELDVVVSALFLDGDEVVARDRAASLTHLGWAQPPGQRYPVYPWAMAFMSGLSPSELAIWLGRQTPPISEEEKRKVYQQIEFARQHGYIFAVNPSDRRYPVRLGAVPTPAPEGQFEAELEPPKIYNLLFFTAPVTNESGAVAFALALSGFSRPYSGAEVAAIGDRLHESCARVTNFITGKKTLTST
jgi:DNA-binding IclR family transcriptional regulator